MAAEKRQHPAMAAISVRLPSQMLSWLNDRAAEEESTMGQEVRNAIAWAMMEAGDLERYGLDLVAEDES